MKNKIAVLWGNCQSDGIVHFLKKTRMGEEYDFHIWHNWQIGMLEQMPEDFIADLPNADLFIYQPCRGFKGDKGHADIPSTDTIVRDLLPKDCVSVSYAYQFNHGLFPLTNFQPDKDGWIKTGLLKAQVWGPQSLQTRHDLMKGYNSGTLPFQCARRFIECLAEQSRREETADIKMVPWILANYQKQRIFLTMNHPTSAMFCELAMQVLDRAYAGQWKLGSDPRLNDTTKPYGPNEARMNGEMPVHQVVVDELGLEYPACDNAHEYYRDLLERMIAAK